MAKVADIRITKVNSVLPSTPVIEVAHQMKISKRSIVPVCDNSKFRGIVTDRDIVTGIVATASDPVTEPASSVMNNRQPIISPGVDVMEAAKLMINKGVQVLAVVENGNLVGLLTLEDLARESLAMAAMVFSKTIEGQVSKQTRHREAVSRGVISY